MEYPLVSVVVTTKNEEKNIGTCLQSVQAQTYPQERIEIIVVDNNSRDRTKEIAREYTEKVYNLGPERSAQRNFGIQEKSAGEYVLFLDADMWLSPQVIEACVQKVQSDPKLLALYIPEIVTGDSFWCKVRRFERSFYNATVIDCVRFIRRDICVAVGGFDVSFTGPEDWDFDKKVRQKGGVGVIDQPLYHNESDFSLKVYLKKKSYYAKSFEKYVKKWGSTDSDIKKQLSFLYRFCRVFVEHGKWKKLIRHPLLTGGMYILRALVGGVYLMKKK